MKLIDGYNDYYITSDGCVYSKKRAQTKKMSLSNDKDGYLILSLRKKGKSKTHRVHRLVANAFILNPENKNEVNHINGNKKDNRVENLEWCSCLENHQHSLKNGLKAKGESVHTSVLKENQVIEIIKKLRSGSRIIDLAKKYSVSEGAIAGIKHKRTWKHLTKIIES